MMTEIVIFDTETTGLLKPCNAPLYEQPQIIEFYGVRLSEDFKIISEVESYIKPTVPISKEITRITGIKESDVKLARSFAEVYPEILALFEGADIACAHNIDFDNGMLSAECSRLGRRVPKAARNLCTVRELLPEYGFRITLSALHKRLFGKMFPAHRAKSDVFALVRVLNKLMEDGVIDLEFYKERV
jgi:DNA polymerase III epsilon subunit-like protein